MNNLPALKTSLQQNEMQKALRDRLGDKAGAFTTSIIELAAEDKYLQACAPMDVIRECMKAGTLELPLNKSLGFAYVIAYKNKPQFQVGYKGYIQLAIRTGLYKHLNADAVYEGEEVVVDRIKGTLRIAGNKTSDKVVGYFSYMGLVNGFEKAIYWPIEDVEAHGKRFSESYKSSKDWVVKSSPWTTDFEAMAKKTMLLQLIPKYGPMTIEMKHALSADASPGNPTIFTKDQQPLLDATPSAAALTADIQNESNGNPFDTASNWNKNKAGGPGLSTFYYEREASWEGAAWEAQDAFVDKWVACYPDDPFPGEVVRPAEPDSQPDQTTDLPTDFNGLQEILGMMSKENPERYDAAKFNTDIANASNRQEMTKVILEMRRLEEDGE